LVLIGAQQPRRVVVPFYEVTFETGRSSVANYADEAEAHRALKEHNRRAMSGEAGGPVAGHGGGPGNPNWAAERIAVVREYAKHPDEFNPEQTMSGDVLKEQMVVLIDDAADANGVVNLQDVGERVKGLAHPMKNRDEGDPFGSTYKMEEDRVLDLGFLTDAEVPPAEGNGS
jgi:hypothetical protein